MGFVYNGYEKLKKNTPLAGNGQCVELIKKYVPGLTGRPTSDWREGVNVIKAGPSHVVPGTAIATFVNGRYPNNDHGNHGAIVLRVMASGIWVVDQWPNDEKLRPQVGVRLIRIPAPHLQYNSDGSYRDPSNNALAFSVIELR